MDLGAPQPSAKALADSLLVAYRTVRRDHFAVVRFSGVQAWSLGPPNDESLWTHPLWGKGLGPYAWHEVQDPETPSPGCRRWLATFHDDTLDVTAKEGAVLVRAVQARDAESALAMVET